MPGATVRPVSEPLDDLIGDDLALRAQTLGVDTQFLDWCDQMQQVDPRTVHQVVQILQEGLQPGQELGLPPCVVMRQDQPARLPLSQTPTSAHVHCFDGRQIPVTILQTQPELVLPLDLPLGDHTLMVEHDGHYVEVALAVCPTREASEALLPEPGQWGIWVQLYAVRSATSWGHGDLADARTLAEHAATQWGADFLLLNPLHAPGPGPVVADSPYLPSSRRYFSPLYLPIEALPEYEQAPPAVRERIAELAQPCQARNHTTELIDRSLVWQAKREALLLLHHLPAAPTREQAFADYCATEGEDLRDFALWCALTDELQGPWQSWPAPLRQRDPHALSIAHEQHAASVRFYSWVQWLMQEQLQLTQQVARQAGMRLGIIHDLAVGAGFDSADAWAWQDVLATGASVGAPPDAFNQLGQDWSQPPWRPQALAQVAYRPYRALLRAVLRVGAGVRIDHILGLFRLWWVPQGCQASHGTYVHYDSEAMLALLALEAYYAGSLVVGEDLGNVGAGVRARLADHALLGTSLLWFEVKDGHPKPAQQWRELSMATVGTHDLPPTAGFITGEHIRVRDQLHLLTQPVGQEWEQLRQGLQRWVQVMQNSGALQPGAVDLPADLATTPLPWQQVQELILGLHRFLAQTPARLIGVGLSDLAADRNMINQPGTYQEYPNWRVPLAGSDGKVLALEDLLRLPWAEQVVHAVTH